MHLFYYHFDLILWGLSAFVLSTLLTYFFINEKIIPNRYSNDLLTGSQKIHVKNVKRIGGLPIISSILIILLIQFFYVEKQDSGLYNVLIYCIFIFAIGFTEDLIKDIRPISRLVVLFIITLIWLFYYKNLIYSTNIDFVDDLIKVEIFALSLTTICIIASLNSTNMMDGANGLLTMFSAFVCIILLIYSIEAKNHILINFLIILTSSLFGFLIFNWPKGFIFLGDGGSYFLGAILSTLLIYMSNNLNNFNMLNALVIMIYPIWELMFTVFRRLYFSSNIVKPDNLHLHTILHANIKKIDLEKKRSFNKNALTGLLINVIALLPSSIFLIYKSNNTLEDRESLGFFITFFSIYTILYLYLVKRNKN